MIPKNIHLVFLSKEEIYPPIFKDCIQRIKELHNEWVINIYNEDDAQTILQEHLPQYLSAYNRFKYKVQKGDFLRLALAYIHGGFYMDMDMLCQKRLDELLNHSLVLGEEKTIGTQEAESLNLRDRLRIANYMFGSEPNHPFWLLLMDKMASLAEAKIESQQDILDKTGPGLLTEMYHDVKDLYPEIFLLRNTDRKCLHLWHNAISCHFGDYAAHLHAGTWRNDIKNKEKKHSK